MGEPFAKLFDTPHGQLLFYKTTNEDDEPIIRVIGAAVGGVVPSAGLAYDTEADRDAGFEKVNQEGAEPQAKAFHDMLAKMFPQSTALSHQPPTDLGGGE